jgi:asparagine synthase (glutamine-hydrolysing)
MSESMPHAFLQRDLGGQRALYYAEVDQSLCFASGAHVLQAHPRISSTLHEETIAAYLAGAPPPEQASIFRDIAALAPGAELKIEQGSIHRSRRYLRPDDSWRPLRDVEIVEQTRVLIENAVVHACEDTSRLGISLSAGLDSSTVASIAACQNSTLIAVTYGFERWPELDERKEVVAFARSSGIDLREIVADDHGTLVDPERIVSNPDFPCTTPFRRLADLAMDRVRQAGASVYLDGNLADHLYANPRDAWSDAIRMRRIGQFLAELGRVIKLYGKTTALLHPGWRRLASRVLRRPHTQGLLAGRLREPWRKQLRERLAAEQAKYRDFPRPEQAAFALDGTAANIVPREQFHAARKGLELRSPFRDPALMRWMLSLPADLSYRDGHCKWLQRASMQNKLPPEVCWRPKTLSPQPFFTASLQTATNHIHELRMAAREWLEAMVEPGESTITGANAFIPWLDAELGLWITQDD